MMPSKSWLIGLTFSALAMAANSAKADTLAGKTVTFVVGVGSGGGFDIYARTIARHLGRFIPGNPNVIVQNMPGAGGGRAAMFMYSVAPKDGTAIAALMPGTIVNPLLTDTQPAPYDVTKLAYLGSADSGTRACVTTKSSGIKTFEDALAKETIVGALAAGSSTYDYAYLIKNMTGAKFKVVTGYTATSEIALAMDRGEVHALCGWDWSSLRTQQPDYANKYNLILQTSVVANPDLEALGMSNIHKYLKSDVDRQAVDLVMAQQTFGRPYTAPAGTPEPVLKMLRTAFDEVMKDKAFLEDADRTKLQILPASGASVQDAVLKIYSTPAEIVARAKSVMKE